MERVALQWTILASVALIGLVVDPFAQDSFRGPKETLFRGSAILGFGLFTLAFVARQITISGLKQHRDALLLTSSMIAWTVVTTIFSTNIALSRSAFITVLASGTLFVCSLAVAQRFRLAHLNVVIIPGIINAALVLSAYLNILVLVDNRSLEDTRFAERTRVTGLLGNANDVGSFLLISALVAVCVALSTSGKQRIFAGVAAAFIGLGMLLSQTLTSIAAFVCAVLILSIIRFGRRSLVPIVLIVAATLAAIAASPAKDRVARNVEYLRNRDYTRIASGRVLAFLAAASMIRDHPVLGVGPGCFKYHFFEYKVAIQFRHPELVNAEVNTVSYGEVHNDHLQVAAETGIIGYVLFVVAGTLLLQRSRSAPIDPRTAFAAAAALVLPVAVAVLALAQFPLQLAATRLTLIFVSALCFGWSVK